MVPDRVSIRSELGLSDKDVSEEELVNDDRVKGLISAEIKLNCYDIKKFEIPVAFLFVSPFTAENNMVTPKVSIMPILFILFKDCLAHFSLLMPLPFHSTKMSIRRHVVIKTYEDMLSELYDGNTSSSGRYLREEEAEVA